MDESILADKIKSGEVYRCDNKSCNGPVKPNIIFFGENLPKEFFTGLYQVPHCDLMIVMGTSLVV